MEIVSLPIQMQDKESGVLDSRFRLVLAAAHRVRQINNGAKPLVATKYHKNTTIALQEVLAGKIDIISGEKARQFKAQERAELEEKMAEMASAEDIFVIRKKVEKREEIEAELKQYIDDRGGETPDEGVEEESAVGEEAAEVGEGEGEDW